MTADATPAIEAILHALGLVSQPGPARTWACFPGGEYGSRPGETWWVMLWSGEGEPREALVVERADQSVTWTVYVDRRVICGAKPTDVATAKRNAECALAVVDRLVTVMGAR